MVELDYSWIILQEENEKREAFVSFLKNLISGKESLYEEKEKRKAFQRKRMSELILENRLIRTDVRD